MKILSIDAGAVSMGISFFDGERVTKLATVRLIPSSLNFKEFSRKYGGRSIGLLVRNLLDFAKHSPDWSPLFKTTEKLIYETNSLKFTHALTHGINSWVREVNPTVDILWVRPFDISRKYGIGGKSRANRKSAIRKIVFEKLKLEDPGVSKIPQDPVDSILHIFYILERKKPEKFLLPCPSWSCASIRLTRSST